MQALVIVAGVLLSPLLGFGLLFWLAHLEDTLPRDVDRARRKPDPPPILAIPVRRVAPTQAVTPTPPAIPAQRTAPVPELTVPTERPEPGPAVTI